MAKKKAVAKTETPGQIALPDWMAGHEGAGQDAIERDDITMPRLKLGQAMSAEVKEGFAQEGDLFHNITRDILCAAGDTLRIIPVAYSKEYILWYDRKGPKDGIAARAQKVFDRGNVRYRWDKPNQVFQDSVEGIVDVEYETKEFIDEDGLNLWGSQIPGNADSPPAATEHFNYVVILPDHDFQMISMSLSVTAGKKAKEFNTMLKMGKAPTFGRIYKVGSFMDSKGDTTWANYQFSGFEMVTDPAMGAELADLYNSLKDKGINVDFSDEGDIIDQDDDKF